MPRTAPLLALLLLIPTAVFAAADPCREVKPHLAAGARALDGGEADGAEAFANFRKAVAEAARKGGAADLAKRLNALEPGRPVADAAAPLASCLLRSYVRAAYGERMVRDLQTLVGFRTFVPDGEAPEQRDWRAPEFERQRKWLAERAGELELAIKDFDGRVVEVTLPGPGPVLAVLTHGDVQGVEGQEWSSPPWEGRKVGDRIVGRGTEDDKGPIVATLYALAALDDTGWPHSKTLRLLIANGEESNWTEIPYYLERAAMPEQTIGVDASYPVTHAQKGYGVLTFRAPALAGDPGTAAAVGDDWRVLSLAGGSGMSIIPERGEARLAPPTGMTAEAALAELSRRAGAWTQKHAPASLEISRDETAGSTALRVVAHGKGGHSSVPESGHNALADLAAFLSTLDLQPDGWGAVALFVGRNVGTGTDGAGLGIAHRDPVMGALTSSLSFLHEVDGGPAAQINIRHPQGIAEEEITRRMADKVAAFNRETGAALAAETRFASHPHVVPAEGPLVSGLLAVWEEVTGQPGKPVAIGGGTQARLFQGGVDFGPASGMERYRGHGPDEYLTVDELHRIAELTVAALWRLGR